jgi:hypothetical protein
MVVQPMGMLVMMGSSDMPWGSLAIFFAFLFSGFNPFFFI